ncbi:MAG: hypothetical protein RLZZ591_511 [Pseudomonadota bacterium]|jgi:pilus assembly protein FimV
MISLPANRKRIAPNLRLSPKAILTTSAVAIPILLLGSSGAWALALGRVTVQSALGETLRAEIELAEISTDEANSLNAALASATYYRAAGLEFPSALGPIEIKLQQRADQRSILQIRNNRPVNEPFVDLIIEARWAAGRLVRDYTLLFSPPPATLGRQTPSGGTHLAPAQGVGAPVQPVPVPENVAAVSAAPPERASAPASEAIKPVTTTSPTTAPVKQTVRVKAGDTANKIALEHKQARLSLDQMLVALLRANPQAFIQENIHWLKNGALLQLPSEDEVLATSVEQARDILAVQSQDFNAFRKNLAANASRLSDLPADRRAQGRVQADATATKTASPGPDRLTLTKDKSQDKDKVESIAGARQKSDDELRASAIKTNIDSLQKISEQAKVAGAEVSPQAAPPARPSASAGQTTPSLTVATNTPPAADSEGSSPSTSPAVSGFLTAFLSHPLVIPAAGVLLALLGAFGFYRSRRHKSALSPHLIQTAGQSEPALDGSMLEDAKDTQFADMSSEPPVDGQEAPMPDLDLDLRLDLAGDAAKPVDDEPLSSAHDASSQLADIDIDGDQALMASADSHQKPEMPTFDFQGLSLELDTPPEDQPTMGDASQDASLQDPPAPKTLNQVNS